MDRQFKVDTIRVKIDDKISENDLPKIKYVFIILGNILRRKVIFTDSDIDILYAQNRNKNSRLFIYHEKIDYNKYLDLDIKNVKYEKNIPFLFWEDIKQGKLVDDKNINNDIIFTIFWLLTGGAEKHIPKDNKDRHLILKSSLFKNNLIDKPIVNIYAYLIRDLLGIEKANYIWGNRHFGFALTHDVDYPEEIKWIEFLRYILKNPKHIFQGLAIFKRKKRFWKFNEWLEIERKYDIKSTFFFSSFKGSLLRYFLIAPDPFYNIGKSKFKDVFNLLKENNCEIALHPSYNAYKDFTQFKEEKEKLEKYAGVNIIGVRHHYYHLNPDHPEETFCLHQKLGFLYDSSLAFEKHFGFRRGVCTPFRLFDTDNNRPLDLIEFPVILTEEHSFKHLKNTSEMNYKENIKKIISIVKDYNGLLVVNYHVRTLDKLLFPNYRESLFFLIDKINELSHYSLKFAEIYEKYKNIN